MGTWAISLFFVRIGLQYSPLSVDGLQFCSLESINGCENLDYCLCEHSQTLESVHDGGCKWLHNYEVLRAKRQSDGTFIG